MHPRNSRILISFLGVFVLWLGSPGHSHEAGMPGADPGHQILSLQDRARVMNQGLAWRLDHILPDLMRSEGVDMWLVINREWIEDPVFFTLVPEPMMASPGCVALIFHDRGQERGVERLSCSSHGVGGSNGPWYNETWTSRQRKQFESLAGVIKDRNPKKIGINVSSRWGYGDGLTASLKEDLEKALGPEFSARLVSAGDLCVRWLETRSPAELSLYRSIGGIAHDIIREFFSSAVIAPDITTTENVVWWIRKQIAALGLETWFQPSISIQRNAKEPVPDGGDRRVIRRGDLLHCDMGIKYLGLCTDMQWHAYVCRIGEEDAPAGLREALKRANRVAEIFMIEFKEGKTGREIALAAMGKAEAEGLGPSIYSHPVGVHGHGAGCTLNAVPPERQDERNVLRWNWPLHANTAYAIELSSASTVPEWNNQEVRIAFEETAAFTKEGCRYIDGHQTEYYLIK